MYRIIKLLYILTQKSITKNTKFDQRHISEKRGHVAYEKKAGDESNALIQFCSRNE